MDRINPIKKLLTHRVRGFSKVENSSAGFEAACDSEVRYIEIDTRASEDGRLFVYHDPSTGADVKGKSITFASAHATELSLLKYASGEMILSLEQAVDSFASRRPRTKFLCIDIKDYGFEEQHLRLIRAAGIEAQTVFISWIPQTLIRLAELGSKSSLMLSHSNTFRLGTAGRIIGRFLRNRCLVIGRQVVFGIGLPQVSIDRYGHGFQHALICQELGHRLVRVLSGSGGGVCVSSATLHSRLTAYCENNSLQLWVFSAMDTDQFLRIAQNPKVQVVFSDDAPAVISRFNQVG